MTEDEARALATKREAHKSKHMTMKRWSAVHDSVKGWHVALIDNHTAIYDIESKEARRAYDRGDLDGYLKHAKRAGIASIAMTLENLS